jgi:ribosome-associated protein
LYCEDLKLGQLSARTASTAPSPALSDMAGDDRRFFLRLVHQQLDDLKAQDIVELDLEGKTSLADAMLVASGTSDRHVRALAEKVIAALKDAGSISPRVEGLVSCDWVLIDAGDLIVHLFRPEIRGFYNLEKIWGVDRPQDRG